MGEPIEPATNTTEPIEPAEPIAPTTNSTACEKLKDAKKLNKDLLDLVKKLEKKMDHHANETSKRGMKMKNINNTYSKFPVNNTISYKKFLNKVRAKYETGYYQTALDKLQKSLENFKFDANTIKKCEDSEIEPATNTTEPIAPADNTTEPIVDHMAVDGYKFCSKEYKFCK